MSMFVYWYLLFAILGIIAFPIVFRVLPGIAGRGYAFGRIAGLLLWGYAYWLMASLGVLQNNVSGILFSLAVVTALSVFILLRTPFGDFIDWWREHRRMVLGTELIFIVFFAFWAWIRAITPEITATEKPMELAFLNAIMRSPAFPPADPWLSGYSISYYYFGYVMISMVAMLTGTPAGVAFNLGIALIFALAAVGAYGLLYALLSREEAGEGRRSAALAFLGPVFVLLVSNFEGFLDMLHARGVFWRAAPDGSLVSGFWTWLDLKDLVNAPMQPFSWLPQRFLWWWRASRVINDVSLGGVQQEVIDEFPFFSFLLSDLHPHVLAIPFVLLAICLAANLFFRRSADVFVVAGRRFELSPAEFGAATLSFGALAFLNTWDFPIYVALFAAAYIFKRNHALDWDWNRVIDAVLLSLGIIVAGVLLYLPFYIGFSSQAGGILPNVLNPTRGAHLWVMFGALFTPLGMFFVFSARRQRPAYGPGFRLGFGLIGVLWLLTLIVMLLIYLSPGLLSNVLSVLGAPSADVVLQASFIRRFTGFGGWLTLGIFVSMAIALALRSEQPKSDQFAVVMVVIGLLLVIAPEFVYLRDLFSTRMNTIFKFYYQAWILMGLGAAYAGARIVRDWRSPAGSVAVVALAVVVMMALTYPTLSLYTKTNGFQPTGGLNLDGTLHNAYLQADDRAAIEWLTASPRGTIVEAVGGSYSSAARIATHSGYPNVLGWVFHQGQWRGGYEEVGSREGDIKNIYESANWDEVRVLLETYDVRYLYVGTLERASYAVSEAKFRRNLPVLFEQGSVVIYGFDGAR